MVAQTVSAQEKAVLQELGKRYAAITALPIHKEKRELWRRLNGLDPVRPLIMIDQVCWTEMNRDGALNLCCEDPFLRDIESHLRQQLYQWDHFPVDKVFEPVVPVARAVSNTGFGITVQEQTSATDDANPVLSHKYENLFETEEDLARIQTPRITSDPVETERRLALALEIFDGILEVRLQGVAPYLSLWDPISTWMSVEEALMALIDRPDYIHQMLERMTHGYMSMLDSLEEQGLLCQPQSTIHCTGAYTEELPASGYDPERPRCADNWMFGLAQMLGSVSSDMYDEFEVQYISRITKRFGLVYYGCCEPLDVKMDVVRKIPNVRKVSMSPWVDPARGAQEIGGDYVYSCKPNPAHVAMTRFDSDLIRKELTHVRDVCRGNGCPVEFILKDLSTVCHEPDRLDRWAMIAREVAEE